MKSLVNYAVKYAEKGLYVLPMMDKQPLIDFADQPPMTPEKIKAYWSTHAYAQIAVRTVQFFVIDIDTKDAHGADGFKSIETVKDLLPETLMQETASGGRQLFYLKPSGVEVRQNIGWLPGVDVKAHINNYVMIAPSNRNGKQYRWLNKHAIVAAPKDLVQLINKKAGSAYSGPDAANIKTEKTATSTLFEQVVNGLGETGGRNNALTSFIGGLLFRGVGVEETYKLAKMANESTSRSLDAKEFDRTFESMVKKEIRRRELADGISRATQRNAKNQ